MNHEIQKLNLIRMVTALHVESFDSIHLLFSSMGPYLNIWHMVSGERIGVYQSQVKVIHAFKRFRRSVHPSGPSELSFLKEKSKFEIMIFGQRFCESVEIHFDPTQMTCQFFSQRLGICSDLIWDLCPLPKTIWEKIQKKSSSASDTFQNFCSPQDENDLFCVILAHNTIEIFCRKSMKKVMSIFPALNSILYSASLFCDLSEENLWIASGTVYNSILIWNIFSPEKLQDELMGHSGVIFRICWSSTGNQIVTVSDDRTVRVWEQKPRITTENFSDQKSQIDPKIEQSKSYSFQLIATMFGHEARIWDCLLLSNYIITCGEDALMKIWDRTCFECKTTLSVHRGQHVWRLCSDEAESVLVTGGGDTCVKLWNLKDCIEGSIQCSTEENEKRQTETLVQCICFNPKNYTECFLIDIKGNLNTFNNETSETKCLYRLWENENLADSKFLSMLALENYLVVSSHQTDLTLFSLSQQSIISTWKITKPSQEVRLFPVDQKKNEKSENVLCWLSSCHTGYLTLWKVSPTEISAPPTPFAQFGKENTITWAVSTCLIQGSCYLISGASKSSDIYIFPFPDHPQRTPVTPIYTFSQLNFKGITDLLFLKESQELYALGLNGYLGRFKLFENAIKSNNNELKTFSLETMNYAKAEKNINRADKIFYRNSQIYCFGGSTSMKFASLYNFSTQSKEFLLNDFNIVYKYSIYVSEDLRTFKQIYITPQKRLGLVNFHKSVPQIPFVNSILGTQFHGRDGNKVKFLAHDSLPGIFCTISGAEDNALKLSRYTRNTKTQQHDHSCFQTLNNHNAGIKNLSTIHSSTTEKATLIFSCSGMNEICCSRFYHLEPSGFCQPVHLTWVPEERKTCSVLGTRVMDVACLLLSSALHLFCLAAVQTDGLIKVFGFSESERKVWPLGVGNFHQSAIFSAAAIELGDTSLLVTGGSGGSLFFSCLDPLIEPFLTQFQGQKQQKMSFNALTMDYVEKITPHLAGVNRVETVKLDETTFRVISGSDDQSLHVTTMKLSPHSPPTLRILSELHTQAHNASLVDLCVVNSSFIFTTSADQRVSLWSIEQQQNETPERLSLVSSVVSDVSDTHGIDACFDSSSQTFYISVIGAGGFQLLQFCE